MYLVFSHYMDISKIHICQMKVLGDNISITTNFFLSEKFLLMLVSISNLGETERL